MLVSPLPSTHLLCLTLTNQRAPINPNRIHSCCNDKRTLVCLMCLWFPLLLKLSGFFTDLSLSFLKKWRSLMKKTSFIKIIFVYKQGRLFEWMIDWILLHKECDISFKLFYLWSKYPHFLRVLANFEGLGKRKSITECITIWFPKTYAKPSICTSKTLFTF